MKEIIYSTEFLGTRYTVTCLPLVRDGHVFSWYGLVCRGGRHVTSMIDLNPPLLTGMITRELIRPEDYGMPLHSVEWEMNGIVW